jgi:hypothetical protein
MLTMLVKILFISLCILFLWLCMTIKEPMEDSVDPDQQRGKINHFKKELNEFNMTSTSIDSLQDKADKQQEQVIRLESIMATLEAKIN